MPSRKVYIFKNCEIDFVKTTFVEPSFLTRRGWSALYSPKAMLWWKLSLATLPAQAACARWKRWERSCVRQIAPVWFVRHWLTAECGWWIHKRPIALWQTVPNKGVHCLSPAMTEERSTSCHLGCAWIRWEKTSWRSWVDLANGSRWSWWTKTRLASWDEKRHVKHGINWIIYIYIIHINICSPPRTYLFCLIRRASFGPGWVLWIIPYIWANFRWGLGRISLTERPASRIRFHSWCLPVMPPEVVWCFDGMFFGGPVIPFTSVVVVRECEEALKTIPFLTKRWLFIKGSLDEKLLSYEVLKTRKNRCLENRCLENRC